MKVRVEINKTYYGEYQAIVKPFFYPFSRYDEKYGYGKTEKEAVDKALNAFKYHCGNFSFKNKCIKKYIKSI